MANLYNGNKKNNYLLFIINCKRQINRDIKQNNNKLHKITKTVHKTILRIRNLTKIACVRITKKGYERSTK